MGSLLLIAFAGMFSWYLMARSGNKTRSLNSLERDATREFAFELHRAHLGKQLLMRVGDFYVDLARDSPDQVVRIELGKRAALEDLEPAVLAAASQGAPALSLVNGYLTWTEPSNTPHHVTLARIRAGLSLVNRANVKDREHEREREAEASADNSMGF